MNHSLLFICLIWLFVAVAPLAAIATSSTTNAVDNATPESLLKASKDPYTAYLFYLYNVSHNRLDAAEKFLKQARELDSSSQLLLIEQSTFAAMRGDLKQARALAEKALDANPNNSSAITLLGKIFASQDYHLKATELYENAIAVAKRHNEDPVPIYPLLIQEYLRLGDVQKAFNATKALLAYSKESTEGYFFLGIIYDEFFRDLPKAIRAYSQVLLYNPHDLIVLNRLAQLYISMREYDTALKLLRKIEEISPNDPNTLLKIAFIDYEQGKKEEAKDIFEKIAKENPDSDRVHYYLGLLYLENGNFDNGRKELKAVPKNSDYYKDATTEVITSYLKEKEWKRAERKAKDALSAYPNDLQFYELLASAYEKSGKPQKAEALWKSAPKIFLDNPRYHIVLALYYDRQGNWEAALSAMQQALALEPENTIALNYIGYTYADRNIHLNDAVKLLRKAKSLDPNNGYILDSLGWAYYRMEKWEEARHYLERARQLSPDEATILNHIGDLYLKLGKSTEAMKAYRDGLQLLKRQDPTSLSREDTQTLQNLKTKVPKDEQ